jgi:hypothetical protein
VESEYYKKKLVQIIQTLFDLTHAMKMHLHDENNNKKEKINR